MASHLKVDFAKNLNIDNYDISNFYSNNWNRPIALYLPNFLSWQYGAKQSNDCVVVERNNKIIGVMAAKQRNFFINDKVYNGAELSTWVVSEEARGLGAGKEILEFLQGKFQILFGAGITPKAQNIYISKGFSFLAQVPRFIFISNFLKINAFCKQTTVSKSISLSRRSGGKITYRSERIEFSEIEKIKNYDKFIGFERSSEFFKWRYENHPNFKYESFLVLDQNNRKTVVILRLDKVRNTDFIHVCDIYGDQTDLRATIAFLENFAHEADAAFIDFTTTSNQIVKILRKRGWLSAIDDHYCQIPSLFHPVESTSPATTSLIFWSGNDIPEILSLSDITLTKGDLDLDRPTLHYINSQKKTPATLELKTITYHYVRPIKLSHYRRIKALDLEKFTDQIDYLSEKFEIVSPIDLRNAILSQSELPQRACLLTFDDGYIDHFRYVFPILHERNLGALFFPPKHSFLDRKILEVNKIQFVLAVFESPIELKQKIDEIISKEDRSAVAKYEKDFFKADRFDVASVVYIKQLLQHAIDPQKRKKIIDSLFHQYVTSDERSFCEDLYLNLSQAKTMAACGMEFGGHGSSHLWHNQSTENEVLSEVKGSIEVIRQIYGEFEKPFYCYPYGGFDNRTIKLLKSHGFLASFTVAPNKTKYTQQGLFKLDRFDTTDFH